MPDQGPGLDRRLALGADVGVVDQVVGHQVDGAFDAREVTAQHLREGPQQRRLADADIALQQHVAAREDGRVDEADDARLADHRLGHLGFERQRALAPVAQQRIVSIHSNPLELASRRPAPGDRSHGAGATEQSATVPICAAVS